MNESVNTKAWRWAAKKNLNSAQILSWLQILSWRPLELAKNIEVAANIKLAPNIELASTWVGWKYGLAANIKLAANIELASTWVVAVHFQCLPHAESRAAGLGGLTDHRRPPGSLHCQSSWILNLKSQYLRCKIGWPQRPPFDIPQLNKIKRKQSDSLQAYHWQVSYSFFFYGFV